MKEAKSAPADQGKAWHSGQSRNAACRKTEGDIQMKSILIKDTTREERIRIVQESLWGACGSECEFCSGCDNRGGGRVESLYEPYIEGKMEIREINERYRAPDIHG